MSAALDLRPVSRVNSADAVPPPAWPREPAHVIRSDAEAITVAHRLAAAFAEGAALRDRDGLLPIAEIEAFSPKFYATGALFAHVVVVVAADDDGRSAMVFVERDTPGLQLVDDWLGFGQRTTGSGTVLFDNVRVTPFQIVSHQDVFDRPTSMGPVAQLIHAAVDVGIARAALADTLAFTRRYARPFFETNYERGTPARARMPTYR